MKATLTGTAGEERAGGVDTDAAGNVYAAIAAAESVNGQPFAGDKDLVLIKRSPAGATLGVPALADRGYAIATDAAANIYVTGYTRGDLAGTNQGDKDVFLLKLGPTGTQLWLRQFGGADEDRGWGVAATAEGIRVAGMTSGTMGTPVGALDGWVARYDGAGSQVWLTQFGTSATAGDFDGPPPATRTSSSRASTRRER